MRRERAAPFLRLACGVTFAALASCGCGNAAPPEEQAPARVPYASEALDYDSRLSRYLEESGKSEHFDGDTSDWIETFVTKLEYGQLEVRQSAQSQLAAEGPRAVGSLRRMFERHYDKQHGAPVVQNVLQTLGLMDGPYGRELFRKSLSHPSPTVRIAAVRALKEHGDPSFYEALLELLELTPVEQQPTVAEALYHVDETRLGIDFARWLEEGRYPVIHVPVAALFAATEDPATAGLLGQKIARVGAELRPYLAAAAAKHGDLGARETLRVELRSPNPSMRLAAATGLQSAGLLEEMIVLIEDEDAALRGLAVEVLARLSPNEERTRLLRQALGDQAADVRLFALGALVRQGDEDAQEHALELLKGNYGDFSDAVRALSSGWETDTDLARRSLEVLCDMHGRVAPANVEGRSRVAAAIGRVPLSEAARFLLQEARRAEGVRSGMSAHRWFVLKAGNTGLEGRRVLMRAWQQESSAERRLDLIEASVYGRDEAFRSFALAALDDTRTSAHEKLYLAMWLVRIGPQDRVAARLKRLALEVEVASVRLALQRLLWEWYGT